MSWAEAQKDKIMFTENEKVLVVDGNPHQEGVVEKVSTWGEVNGVVGDVSPCYFVRVPSWNNNTNGGRWLGVLSLAAQPQPDENQPPAQVA